MQIPTIVEIETALLARGWVIHREVNRLNVVLLRRMPGTLDAFDDMLVLVWTSADGVRRLWACRCTTDPGRPARENPRRVEGTAVMAEQQMVDGYELGLHHPGTPGAYECLRPVRPVAVLRYTSVDDPTGTPSTSTQVQIHRANPARESTVVGGWSEGCVVVANPAQYETLLAMVRRGPPRVTVSLLEWAAG